MKPLLRRTLSVFIGLSAGALVTGAAFGQSTPRSNSYAFSNNKPAAWTPNSTVTVMIDASIGSPGSSAYNSVVAGYSSDASAYSFQGVTFQFVGVNSCPNLQQNQLYVVAGPSLMRNAPVRL